MFQGGGFALINWRQGYVAAMFADAAMCAKDAAMFTNDATMVSSRRVKLLRPVGGRPLYLYLKTQGARP